MSWPSGNALGRVLFVDRRVLSIAPTHHGDDMTLLFDRRSVLAGLGALAPVGARAAGIRPDHRQPSVVTDPPRQWGRTLHRLCIPIAM